jgi:hypothetical protein
MFNKGLHAEFGMNKKERTNFGAHLEKIYERKVAYCVFSRYPMCL